MLTRDISLEDCILDLIDNSIDSAWKQTGARPTAFTRGDLLAPYSVAIEFGPGHFRITDNCGGISLIDAEEYAFTFGRKAVPPPPEADPSELDEQTKRAATDYSVGVYGIGMKRAVFKVGNDVTIKSTHGEGVAETSFQVPIDVRTWLADERTPWDFSIEDTQPLPEPGVRIEIRDLNEDASRRLGDPLFQQSLEEILRRDYMIALMQSLTITVNTTPVAYKPITLLSGEGFAPQRSTYEDGDVVVEIISGTYRLPPDDNDPESSRQDRTSGWYVVCNGRVILAADRSEATGWGYLDFPRWHGQYGGFIGIVFFSSADASLLPMTTTKRNVNTSSALYQRALNLMTKPARAWLDYTNARKAALEKAKELESRAVAIEASSVALSPEVVLPKISASRAKVANVNYSVPLSKMKALADGLGNVNLSYRDVGLISFDYTYDAHVDEDA